MSAVAKCLWCDGDMAKGRRGSPRRFCRLSCRVAFHRAARRWAIAVIDAGLITVADLRMASGKAYTLSIGPSNSPAVLDQPLAPE